MATTSEWTVWVEATTDASPGGSSASAWSGWVETTTSPAPAGEFRKVRQSGVWVGVVDRKVRRSGTWV